MIPNARGRILIVQDSATTVLLRGVLGNEGYELVETTSGEEALAQVSQQPIDLAIVDTELPGMDGLSLCRRLRQNGSPHDILILILCSSDQVADKIAGFEAGADDYVTKPFQPQELIYRIKILMGRRQRRTEPKARARGRVIALFGTKGGVGRTTIGVNLAVALQRRSRKRTVLFDADFFFGDVALHLGVPPAHTILDLIGRMDELDAELLDQVLVPHPSGVRVLLSPRNPEDVETILPDHVTRLLDFLVCHYDFVVVDCQAIYDERTLTILEKADAIMLIIKPEVGCVKNMAVFSELAVKLGLSFDKKIHIVLNRSGSKSGIGSKEIERIFRRQIAFHIASGGNSVVVSINRGVPLMIEQPNHPFSLQVIQIADHLIRDLPVAGALSAAN